MHVLVANSVCTECWINTRQFKQSRGSTIKVNVKKRSKILKTADVNERILGNYTSIYDRLKLSADKKDRQLDTMFKQYKELLKSVLLKFVNSTLH